MLTSAATWTHLPALGEPCILPCPSFDSQGSLTAPGYMRHCASHATFHIVLLHVAHHAWMKQGMVGIDPDLLHGCEAALGWQSLSQPSICIHVADQC